MSQISPPIRILLVAAVALAAVWVLVLQPKSDDVEPAPEPTGIARDADGPVANTKLGQAVQAAEGAAQQSEERSAAVSGETAQAPSTTATEPATSVAKEEAPVDPALAKLPDWLASSMDKKVVAILFWNRDASDDRRTHAALGDAFKADGRVVTRSVPIGRIARYGSVARGVDITQSPTLMVIDRERNATALVGYVNVDTINQAIIDGLLATDNPAKKVAAVGTMQDACRGFATAETISAGDATESRTYGRDLAAVSASLADTLKAAPAVKSGPYRSRAKLLKSYVRSEQGVVSRIRGGAMGGKFVDSRAIRQAQRSNDRLEARATLELNAIGVTGCN